MNFPFSHPEGISFSEVVVLHTVVHCAEKCIFIALTEGNTVSAVR